MGLSLLLSGTRRIYDMLEINGLVCFDSNYNEGDIKNIHEKMNNNAMLYNKYPEMLYFNDQAFLGLNFLPSTNNHSVPKLYWNDTHDKVIAFTGTIYNKREVCESFFEMLNLKENITDAQIVLYGIELYGIDFLKKLEGTYLFVIFDKKTKNITLVRDRLGSIPLYYYNNNGIFVFSTTLKNLLSSGLIQKKIDKEALSQYMQLTYIPAPKSIIENVKKMLPATIISINDNGELSSNTYWNISINSHLLRDADYNMCKKKLHDTLIEAVEKRMKNEDSIGAFLSGGFDSTIIVGIMSMLSKKPINTFTVGFNDRMFDERNLAKIISEKNKTNHHELILDLDNVFNDIEEILKNMDEPYADSSLIATYSISKAAKKYVSTVLTGDGGDELFAGYNKYLVSYYSQIYNKIPKCVKKGLIEPVVSSLPRKSRFRRKASKLINTAEIDIFSQRKQLMCLGFKDYELTSLMNDEYVDSMEFLEHHYNALKDADEQMKAQYIDLKVVLEGDMLPKVYKASSITGINSRAPLLDTSVIELAYKIPSQFKINRTKRKIILKDTFSNLIPRELYSAPKHGFGVPIELWLEHNLKDNLLKYASPNFLESQKLFNADYIAKIINEHFTHMSNRYSELWAFYVFQDWYVKFFDIKI